MGARFKGTFYSAYTSQKYDLTIIDQSGSFVLNEVTLTDCRINYLSGEDSRFDTVMAAELSAKVVIDTQTLDDFVLDLAGAPEGRFLLKLEQNSTLEFIGYVLPDLAEQEDLPLEVGYLLTLKATDGLGRLKTIDYNNGGAAYGGETKVLDIILKCLNKLTAVSAEYGAKADFLKTLVNWHAEQYTYANTIDPLFVTRVPERAFYTKDTKGNYKWLNCFQVLEIICKAWGARMLYSSASFWFVQVNELAIPTNRKFFNYSKTGTQTSATISIQKTHDQNSASSDLVRISGGKFTFLPPLKHVQIDYKHIATENLLPGYEWNSTIGTNPQTIFAVDEQGGLAKLFVNFVLEYGADTFTNPPGEIPLWFVFNITVQVAGAYVDRLVTFANGVPQYGGMGWSGSATNGYQVALYVPTSLQSYTESISFLTNTIPATGDLVFDVYLHSVYNNLGQQINTPVANYYWQADNMNVEHLYEGTFSAQSDIRRFKATNDTTGNSATIDYETLLGDGIGVNSPGHLQVLNDSAAWVLAEDWRVGNSGSYVPFTALLCAEVIRGQLTPIRKFNGQYDNKGTSLYRAHHVIDHAWGKLVMMSAEFDLYLDSANGIWFYIDPQATGWTQVTAVDYPEGEGLEDGTPRLRSITQDDTAISSADEFFREDFTNVTDELNVTVNNGVLPVDPNRVQVFKNGELLNPDDYTISGSTITLDSTADPADVFEVLFSAALSYTPPGTFFRQRFDNVTDTITITANNGNLPTSKEQIVIFQNGQLINPTAYSVAGSVITLSYPAFVGDMVEVLFPIPFGQIQTGISYREQHTGITTTITATGILPTNADAIQIYQNGLLLQEEYYTISNNTITLTYTAETTDTFTITYIK
jgi:hypothetical protein